MQPHIVRARAMPPGTPEVPVVIIGAGACGLTAALMLRDAGIDCVLLERDAEPQGSTALSSGFIPAAGTAVQRAAGVFDSAAAFAVDIQGKAQGLAPPHLVAAYTEAVGPALDALQQRHGLAFELLDGFLYPGHTQRRMHSLVQRTGASLMAALTTASARAGAITLCGAHVLELWCDDRSDQGARVLGLVFVRPDGQMEYVAARVVLLANNGFGGNTVLRREFLPQMQHAIFAGHVGNDGSAIFWARDLGLALADMGACQGHGGWAVPQGVLISWALMMQGGVQVNRLGQRFHDETQGYSEAALQVLAQPGGVAWNVFDERLLALGRTFPDFCMAESHGALRSAGSVAGLAALIGCPAGVLEQTLAAHASSTHKTLVPPLHAVQVTGALFHTQGGISIDAACRALCTGGQVHPNLLAAGGAARGVSGPAIWGYLSGNGLLSAVAGGAIAARTAAALLAE